MKSPLSFREALGQESCVAWIVLTATFFINIFGGFTSVAFSMLYQEFIDHFRVSATTAGWMGSIQVGFGAICVLFVSPLVERFGCRPVSIVGSVLLSSSLVISSQSTHIWMTYITYGILPGLAFSFLWLTIPVIIQQHFIANRALANGISMIGLNIGTILAPLLFIPLLETYGWRGALIMQGGICLHMIPCALLFYPSTKHENEIATEVRVKAPCAEEYSNQRYDVCDKTNRSTINGCDTNYEAEYVDLCENGRFTKLSNGGNDSLDLKSCVEDTNDGSIDIKCATSDDASVKQNYDKLQLSRADRVASTCSKCDTVRHFQDCALPYCEHSIHLLKSNEITKTIDTQAQESQTAIRNTRNSSYFRKIFDFTLCCWPSFTLFSFAVAFAKAAISSFHPMLMLRSLNMGFEQSKAAYLLSVTFIADFACRVVVTVVSNMKCIPNIPLIVFVVGMFVGAIGAWCVAPAEEYVGIALACILYGIHTGSTMTVVTPCITDIVGIDNISRAQALNNFGTGAGFLVSIPFSGWLVDITQNYNVPFYVIGSISAAGGLLSLASLFINTCRQTDKPNNH